MLAIKAVYNRSTRSYAADVRTIEPDQVMAALNSDYYVMENAAYGLEHRGNFGNFARVGAVKSAIIIAKLEEMAKA